MSAALEKARALAAIDVVSIGDVEKKARLHAEAVDGARAACGRRRRRDRRRAGRGRR